MCKLQRYCEGMLCFEVGDGLDVLVQVHVVHAKFPVRPAGVYGSLGNAYQSQGHYAKAIEYHTQDLAIAKEVGDRAGRAGRTESSALATCT